MTAVNAERQKTAPQTDCQQENPPSFLYGGWRRYKLTTKKAAHTWQGLKYRSPAQGIVDSGLDISVMGGERAAAVAHLQKKDFKVADKVAHTYLENALQAA